MTTVLTEQLFIAGEAVERDKHDEVHSPYDGSVLGRVPVATDADVDAAVSAARRALAAGGFPQAERAAVLDRAAAAVLEDADELAVVLAAEAGKPIGTAAAEVQRCASTLRFSAVEARKLGGSMVPMGADAVGAGKLGFLVNVPIGVVAAITPFNFPLNLVVHKVGPALAGGNPVIVKPAGATPLSALRLARILKESGLPDGWLSVVCGSGGTVGVRLAGHDDVSCVTFTGSPGVGWRIRAEQPRKKVILELGSNAPLIVAADGDWETAAAKASVHAFSNAGQSCISTQRILLHESIASPFTEDLVARTEQLAVGDPLDPATDVGPLITPAERDRVLSWIEEAVAGGGELLCGGRLLDEERCVAPTIVAGAPRESKLWTEEAFGPVATIHRFGDLDEAIELANDTRFGLQVGLFTKDIGRALNAIGRLEYGGVLINEIPTFRTDQMPYGGIKESGNGREGPAYAIQELTEQRLITIQE
ncbi:MAG: aldehyde dehydrogenase family protein [Thermoleophilia bacterium]|nr:aldehyde dehydrogenase family protein [Thermoleophilia bacterium]